MSHLTYVPTRISKQVVQHSTKFNQEQLVAVSQYHRGDVLGYPLAVGRAALSSTALDQADQQGAGGKAVYILHTWKDSLWDLGSSKKLDVPEPRSLVSSDDNAQTETADNANSNPTTSTPVAEGEIMASSDAKSLDTSKDEDGGASQPKQPTPLSLPPEGEVIVSNLRHSWILIMSF